MNQGAWWATVHGVAKSRTRLSNLTSLQAKQSKLKQTKILTKPFYPKKFTLEIYLYQICMYKCIYKNIPVLPDHLTHLLKNLYADQEATVLTGHGTMD